MQRIKEYLITITTIRSLQKDGSQQYHLEAETNGDDLIEALVVTR
jgi:hypothetical protein